MRQRGCNPIVLAYLMVLVSTVAADVNGTEDL